MDVPQFDPRQIRVGAGKSGKRVIDIALQKDELGPYVEVMDDRIVSETPMRDNLVNGMMMLRQKIGDFFDPPAQRLARWRSKPIRIDLEELNRLNRR